MVDNRRDRAPNSEDAWQSFVRKKKEQEARKLSTPKNDDANQNNDLFATHVSLTASSTASKADTSNPEMSSDVDNSAVMATGAVKGGNPDMILNPPDSSKITMEGRRLQPKIHEFTPSQINDNAAVEGGGDHDPHVSLPHLPNENNDAIVAGDGASPTIPSIPVNNGNGPATCQSTANNHMRNDYAVFDAERKEKIMMRKKKKRKLCTAEGCENQARNGGVCVKHGAKRKLCTAEGCDNQVVNGGVCVKHGAKRSLSTSNKRKHNDNAASDEERQVARKKRKLCTAEGCENQARNGVVCVKHGAKETRNLCTAEGCESQARNGGVCVKHGAKVTLCTAEGCESQARNGGVCVKHGAKKKRKLCTAEGCENQARNGGVCVKHGAKRKLCTAEGCENQAARGGVCVKHGAKVKLKVKLCTAEGCENQAKNGGACKRHGG
ncbi:hypothetical protein QTG54_000275 [Skeletonema marinoi]|uniref:WRKY transcription factor 19 n=1 Tax=Skeletonema marinoi TaxID=267567 RepID=A0AAD8YNI6_9STRA|nr:hypothetical protein QTG54_000275 [Skeletonema marinoi]